MYYVVYRVHGSQKWEAAGKTKKGAERLKIKREYEITGGTFKELKRICFSEFADKWIEDYASVSVKPSTLKSYRSRIAARLKPHFGDKDMRRINTIDCQHFIASELRDPGSSAKSVANTLVILKHMFKHAVLWGYMAENPALYVKRPRVEVKEMDFLKPDEIARFLAAANSEYRDLFLTAVLTGMRRGEVLALKWGDVDFGNSTIHVRRSFSCGLLTSPKSRRSKRAIVMSPTLARRLEERKARLEGKDEDFVFSKANGRPLDGQNLVNREFHPALKRAGLRRIRFHDLRHTYASLLIAQGENPKFIQSQLGHASIQTTMDRYGHLLPEVGQGTGERLDRTVFGTVRGLLEVRERLARYIHKKAPEPVTVQGLSLVAGAGFEPATFGL
ncbi:tyrosine-type recombinase/integrase [Candidatus Eisenbacteria bacterium]|uniref:Tyrosine-type recombinase/integrase n=1 Tax=Eiseniibacteriota bacterium TaxID=2212470 RepID=A0ABV6YMK9_UNCEI